MSRTAMILVFVASLLVGGSSGALASTAGNAYGVATATTEIDGVELAVDIAPVHQLPNADPFDVEIICIDSSGLFKWLLVLDANGRASLNLMGSWRSASYYDIDADSVAGVSFSFLFPAPLVNPDDRFLVSISDDAIGAPGPLFVVSVDPFVGQPLRMDALRVTLAYNDAGGITITAANLTHVPLFVPLATLTLGLAPTPDWVPDSTPDIRWVPDPPLSEQMLVVGPDETVVAALPLPAIPVASVAAYRNAMSTVYTGIVDLYPGEYLAIGFPVAWGVSWSYLPVTLP